MAALLYWIVYNFDLGPPTMLNPAVQSWLKRAKSRAQASKVVPPPDFVLSNGF
jgi:hypothetical protein